MKKLNKDKIETIIYGIIVIFVVAITLYFYILKGEG